MEEEPPPGMSTDLQDATEKNLYTNILNALRRAGKESGDQAGNLGDVKAKDLADILVYSQLIPAIEWNLVGDIVMPQAAQAGEQIGMAAAEIGQQAAEEEQQMMAQQQMMMQALAAKEAEA